MRPPQYFRRFDYDKRRLPNQHLQSLESNVTNIDEARLQTGHSIGYPGWGVLYYALPSHLDPARFNAIVETGTNWGCTTIILSQALKDSGCAGRVYTVEICAENVSRAENNLRSAKLEDLVSIHLGDSRNILPSVLDEVEEVSAAFLDSSHLHDDVLNEFKVIHPRLSSDAIVFFDNTYLISEAHEDPRVNGALKTILSEFGGNLVNFRFVSWYTPGLAVWQQKPAL